VDGTPLPLTLAAIRAIVADYGLTTEITELIAGLDTVVMGIRYKKRERERKRKDSAAKKTKGRG